MRKISLSKECLSLLDTFRQKYSTNGVIRNFIKDNKHIVKLGEELGLSINPTSLSRIRNWATHENVAEDRQFQKNNSIGEEALRKIKEDLELLHSLSEDKLIELIRKIKKKEDAFQSKQKRNVGLESFVGTYISFHPDLRAAGDFKILEGKLTLYADKPNPKMLRAFYLSAALIEYVGTCELKGETLYIMVKDNRENISMIARVGLKTEENRPIIEAVTSCINNLGNPVSFRRILIREDYLAENEEDIRAYISRNHQLSETKLLTLDAFKGIVKDLKLSSKLKNLSGKTYLAYNLFAWPTNTNMFQNIWEFREEGGRLLVIRRGGNGRLFEGEAYLFKNCLCVQLQNKVEPKDRRLYYANVSQMLMKNDGYEEICMLGAGINLATNAVVGRELLIRQDDDRYGELETSLIDPNRLEKTDQELHDRIFSYLGKDETAIFKLDRPKVQLDPSIYGYYFVYYLSSEGGKLRRNKARIYQNKGRDVFHYETDDRTYSVVTFHYNEPHLQIRFKVGRQERYLSFFLEIIPPTQRSRAKPETEIITGSLAAIGNSTRHPVANGVVLWRTTKEAFENAYMGFPDMNEIHPKEQIIYDYLNLAASIPMVFEPISNMEQMAELVQSKHKDRFMEFFSKQIRRYTHDRLKPTHKTFIKELIKVIEGFTAQKRIIFKTRYVELFRIFYNDILEKYWNEEVKFYASSYPKEKFFWHDGNKTEGWIKTFVVNKGMIFRIFFIDNENGIPARKELEIIERHYKLYGKSPAFGAVYVANTSRLRKPRIFSTEDYGKISWEVDCDIDRSIRQLDIFTSEEKHQDLMRYYHKLIKKEACVQVTDEKLESWKKAPVH